MQTGLEKIPGVQSVKLQPHLDSRGGFTELYRQEWNVGVAPAQWNADHSVAHTVRGVHAHKRRYDYMAVLWGSMTLALHDARRSSPAFGTTVHVQLAKNDGNALIIPPGVAHAFYFPEDSVTLIGFSDGWDPSDDIRCNHAASELGIAWPGPVKHISRADVEAPGYQDFLQKLEQA